MRVKRRLAILSLLATLICAGSAAADTLDSRRLYLAARGDIPWQSLTPEEQRALRQHRGNWDSYSGDRQRDMRRGAQRYLDLPPQKRQQLERQRQQYQEMSPEERRRLREEYKRQRR